MEKRKNIIIAREGLILLAMVILGLGIYFFGRHLNNVYLIQHSAAKSRVMQNMQYSLVGYAPYMKMMSMGLSIAIIGYPIIAAIRFIRWSLKTLKQKEN
jgi:hypothetical protein